MRLLIQIRTQLYILDHPPNLSVLENLISGLYYQKIRLFEVEVCAVTHITYRLSCQWFWDDILLFYSHCIFCVILWILRKFRNGILIQLLLSARSSFLNAVLLLSYLPFVLDMKYHWNEEKLNRTKQADFTHENNHWMICHLQASNFLEIFLWPV